MIQILRISILERSLVGVIFISLILIVRKFLNGKSYRYASIALWAILLVRLIIPYTIFYRVPPEFIDQPFLKAMISVNDFRLFVSEWINGVFPKINRFIIMILLGIYLMVETMIALRGFLNAIKISFDPRIDRYLKMVPIKRKVTVLVNDRLKYPITIGILHPKIIIQNRILQEEELLKFVLLHEMMHIKHFDVLWNHLKYIIACVYWSNPLVWVMTVYLNEDLEILCDKNVISHVGDTIKNKLDYSKAMFELMCVQEKRKNRVAMNLHPNVERMVSLKNWKLQKIGIWAFAIMVMISATAFVSAEEYRIPTFTLLEGTPVEGLVINEDNRTQEISTDEYESLFSGQDSEIAPFSVDIDSSESLAPGTSKNYTFNMNSWGGPSHGSFVTKISNTSSNRLIEYKLLIEEDGNLIYSKIYNGDISLSTNVTSSNKQYKVTLINTSNAKLRYHISLKSQ